MSDVERFSLLGEGNPKFSKAALTVTEGSQVTMSKEGFTEPNESDIRNWLKGVRDSGYVCFTFGLFKSRTHRFRFVFLPTFCFF